MAGNRENLEALRSNGYQKAQEQLPIAEARKQLISLVQAHQTLVLVGETGSGKSTQLPQFLHRAGLAEVRTLQPGHACVCMWDAAHQSGPLPYQHEFIMFARMSCQVN